MKKSSMEDLHLFMDDGAMICLDDDLQIVEMIQGKLLIIAEDFDAYTRYIENQAGNGTDTPMARRKLALQDSPKGTSKRGAETSSTDDTDESVNSCAKRTPKKGTPKKVTKYSISPRRSPRTTPNKFQRNFNFKTPEHGCTSSPGSISSGEDSPSSHEEVVLPEFSPYVRKALRDGEKGDQIMKMVRLHVEIIFLLYLNEKNQTELYANI